jgi:hypothetical protein
MFITEVKMIKVWKFLSVSIVAAVCLGLLLLPAALPKAVSGSLADEWSYEIQPSTTSVGFNEDFTVNVSAVCYEGNSSSYFLTVVFNSTLLSVTGVDTPGNLPNGDIPSMSPGYPTWSNTTGMVANQYSLQPPYEAPYVDETFTMCTIHFRSLDVSGTSYLKFANVDVTNTTKIKYLITDTTNWTKMVNGTVKVGLPPTISVSPDNLTFNAIEGGANPPDQTLEVCNSGNGTLNWTLTDDNAAWLSETPMSDTLAEGVCEDVTVSVDVTGMATGDYSATITITGSPEVMVPVSLHIESTAPVEPVEPVEPANLSVSSVSISPQQVNPGEEVTISINVANTGGETGSYNAILYINSVVEDSQSVSVAAGTSKTVIFTVSKSQAGVYDVSVAEQSGQFEVVSTGWFGGGLSTGGIVAIVVIVIALIVVLVFLFRRTRRAV